MTLKFGDGISWEQFADEILVETHGDKNKIAFTYTEKKEIMDHITKYVSTGKVIDCGCHMGRWATLLINTGFNYVGIEQSIKALQLATSFFPNICFQQGFLWDIQFSEEFDLAIFNNVLQHNLLPEKQKIIPKIYDALKIGGILFLNESTVKYDTLTQLTYEGWIKFISSYGFEFLESWQPNKIGIDECYLFRKKRASLST